MSDNDPQPQPIVVAICGASGQIYGRRLLETLLQSAHPVHLITSPHAAAVWRDELAYKDITEGLDPQRLTIHRNDHMASPLASGSYPTKGMIICPCTLNTAGAVASGISDTLITRAAQVHLKQRRTLVIAVREMPLSLIDLQNLVRLAGAGATIAPLAPPFYHHPEHINDLVLHVVHRLIGLVTGKPEGYQYPGST